MAKSYMLKRERGQKEKGKEAFLLSRDELREAKGICRTVGMYPYCTGSSDRTMVY
jgi:hypothetical protein